MTHTINQKIPIKAKMPIVPATRPAGGLIEAIPSKSTKAKNKAGKIANKSKPRPRTLFEGAEAFSKQLRWCRCQLSNIMA